MNPWWRRLLRKAVALAVLAAAGAVVYAKTRPPEMRVPIVGREPVVTLSEDEQEHLGRLVYERVVSNEGASVVDYGRPFERVQRVVDNLQGIAERDKPDYDWQFAVVRSERRDAFCLPDGKLVVYTGLVAAAADDAGLAALVAHAIAHAVAHHGAERIRSARLTRPARALAAAADAADEGTLATLRVDERAYARVAALLGGPGSPTWRRTHEREADRIALVYAARAGYDPRDVIAARTRGAAGHFRTAHPAAAGAADLRRHLTEALHEYERRTSIG